MVWMVAWYTAIHDSFTETYRAGVAKTVIKFTFGAQGVKISG